MEHLPQEQRIEAAKGAAGIQEETNTWNGWKQLGYEVIHGSKSLFGVDLIWGSKGDGKMYQSPLLWPFPGEGACDSIIKMPLPERQLRQGPVTRQPFKGAMQEVYHSCSPL